MWQLRQLNICVKLEDMLVKQCSSTQFKFPITLSATNSSIIQVLTDDSNIPAIPFEVETIENVKKAEAGTLHGMLYSPYNIQYTYNILKLLCPDILAICVKVDPVRFIRNYAIRDIYLTDLSKTVIKATVWGESAVKFKPLNYTVIAIRKAKVTTYSGETSLNVEQSTLMWTDPQIQGQLELLEWFKSEVATPFPVPEN